MEEAASAESEAASVENCLFPLGPFRKSVGFASTHRSMRTSIHCFLSGFMNGRLILPRRGWSVQGNS